MPGSLTFPRADVLADSYTLPAEVNWSTSVGTAVVSKLNAWSCVIAMTPRQRVALARHEAACGLRVV